MNDDLGYGIYPHVFPRADMDGIALAMTAETVERTKAGARHVLRVPTVRALANQPRLLDIARWFVGCAPVPFRATLFDKSPRSNWLVVWHQDTALPLCDRVDTPGWGPWSVKAGVLYAHAPAWALEQVVALRVCLDDSTGANGPLRVLPNSHRQGVLTDEQVARIVRDASPIDCLADAGGVVAMRPLTIHASSKTTSDQPRRVLHIEYAANVQLADGATLAVG